MRKFENQVVLITGATRGIGKATAEAFAEQGASVVLNYISTDVAVANQLADSLAKKHDINALAIRADVASDQDVAAMKTVVEQKFGRLDILVNNAGYVVDKPFFEHTKSDFDKIFSVNVYGILNMSKAFGPMITKTTECGSIINMSSTSGMYDFWPDNIDYAGSKLAIQSITRDLAIQFGPKIRVNAVALGWADTDMNKDLPPDVIEDTKRNFILQRMATPEEVAKPIVFLASQDASFVNGTVLVVDGGRVQ